MREPYGSPPSSVVLARKTAHQPVPVPPVSLGSRRLRLRVIRFPRGQPSPLGDQVPWGWAAPKSPLYGEAGALLGSREIPLKACPGLGTPATPGTLALSVAWMLPSASLTASAFATRNQISELILTACFLAMYASHPPVARRMATRATGLPATALTGLDLHQLDFNKRFR